MKRLNKIIVLFLVAPLMVSAKDAVTDSLTLSEVLSTVMNTYPALKKTENDRISANAKTDMTKTAYLPNVDFSAGYTRIGPTTSITMPINGVPVSLQLYPENVYNATLSVNQNIYDFGKTINNIKLAQTGEEMVDLTTEQLKQKLSTAVMTNFYTLSFLQEAIKIKDEQLATLKEHLKYVLTKNATGSATRYDILTTKVRISTIENQKTDLQTSLLVQQSQLNSLLGKPSDNVSVVKTELMEESILPSTDSLCNTAYANRIEMKIVRQKMDIDKAKYNVVNVQNNPSLNFFASGGYKNGYFNDKFKDTGMPNFAVGVGFKVPIFDANRSKYAKVQVNADLKSDEDDLELTRRSITDDVVANRANADAAQKKVEQSELQLKQAEQAYDLAETNYKAGSITNLDLLESYTSVSESKLGLLKSKIDFTISSILLKIALGEKIY